MVECSFKDKILALEDLDIQVKATPDGVDIKVYASKEKVEIQGVIPLALPTTERT
jgi:hypothetical protein